MLLSMKTLLDMAKRENFCIPAPTVWSLETAEAAYEVGRKCKTPLILMVWDDNTAEWIEKIGAVVQLADKKYPDVPCALILDHGQSFRSCIAALRAGYTTVMADYSMMPFEKNIANVRRVVDAAHALNVAVEAELGHVGEGSEYDKTRDSGLTDPSQAVEFVNRTGCDMLAVSVGTSHGTYKGEPRLEFELLEKLNGLVEVPLVLHGGSGTGDDNLRRAAELGIHKVNLCTDLFRGYEKAVRKAAETPGQRFMAMYSAGAEGYMEVLEHYVAVLGSENCSRHFANYLHEPEERTVCRMEGKEPFTLTL